MEELTIEQKAQKYDEAIKKLHEIITMDNRPVPPKEIGEYLFPELKENGDERIRKAIVKMMSDIDGGSPFEKYGIIKKEALAWLEKQSKNNMGISEATKKKLEDNLNKALEKETLESCNEFLEKQGSKKENLKERNICDTCEDSNGCLIPCCAKLLEKQGEQKMKTPEESLGVDSDTYNKIVDECVYGEQKHADKLKFKVGDFLVSDYCMGKVVELTNDAYLLDTEQGIPFSCEHNAHIWTIEDAKAGDMLAVTMYPEGTWIGIFKEYNGCTFSSYCFVNTEGTFKLGTYNHGNGKAIHPATKEQRNTLLKAMSDAGYTFDFDKKELKKIKQKSAWSEEDIELLDNTIKFIEDRVAATSPSLRTYSPTLTGKEIPFLKALKDRVQPKQEWSEEDNRMCKAIIDNIQAICEEGYFVGNIDSNELIKWLKSLKERYTWKPSKREKEALLWCVVHLGGADKQTLGELLEALNKL